jgi:hypothetical protein
MPKRAKLPGAADFFALSEAAPAPAPPGAAPAPASSGARPLSPDLLPSRTVPEGPTEKVTFYLHPLLLKRLELYKAQLLVEHNLKVNRSQILDYLLEQGLRQAEALTEELLSRAE